MNIVTKIISQPRPFVDFYNEKGVIPTRQDIANIQQHFQRREALYRQLGLVPSLLQGSSILEFGPGSGHNAIFTAFCGPSRYVLVDATSASLKTTQAELLSRYPDGNVTIVDSDILTYRSNERFDLVLCEGVIPTQLDPAAFLRHVASFVNDRGLLVITCMDSISLFAEMLRRYIARQVIGSEGDFHKQVELLVEFFDEDFSYLPGMSRQRKDWVIDQILHPWTGPLFSIPEAITAVGAEFDIYGASPNFLTDWRWYKDIYGRAFEFNCHACEQFFSNAHNFLDSRYTSPPVQPITNHRLKGHMDRIYERIFEGERESSPYTISELHADLLRIMEVLPLAHPETLLALNEFAFCLSEKQFDKLKEFRKLWGRGQQYLSFIKRST